MEIKSVMNKYGELEPFQPKRITYKIMEETGLDKEEASKIQKNIIHGLKTKYTESDISTSTIRSLINQQLINKGYIEEEKKSRKLGMSVSDFEYLLENGNKDNANLLYSPEMIAKYSYDAIAKEYALLTMPKDCAEAHKSCYYHIHDLEYYNTRPNCFIYDARFFIRNGLNIDGKELMGSLAGSPKHLRVILSQLRNAFMSGSITLSGGQAIGFWNIFLAPFVRGLSYKQIKQEVQGFIFELNQSLVAKGQPIFTSINVEFEVPSFLKDVPALGSEGIPIGTYKDYEEEAKLLLKALIEVLFEGDYHNRPHRFPNTIFMIRDGVLDKYEGNVKSAHELVAKYPTVYFGNCMSHTGNNNRSYMGCRTQSRDDWTGDWEYDTLNFGNFMYNTLNLPLIAYESKSKKEFINKVEHYCDLTKKSLLHRKSCVEYILYEKHMSDFLLQKDKETGKPLYDLNKNSFSIGYCGLYECMEELKRNNIFMDDLDVIMIIYNKCQEFKKETGLRFSLFATPAESTAGRFANYNKSKYPDAIVQGEKGRYYLTNSHHIPVSSDVSIIEHIKQADKFDKYASAGSICHIWLGESYPNPKSLWKLNKKIAETNTAFWAYSTVFTVCNDCIYTINDKIDICPKCKSENVTNYDRITGYYLPVNGYNDSKKKEWEDRYRHSFDSAIGDVKL